jgi:hypothetical protein
MYAHEYPEPDPIFYPDANDNTVRGAVPDSYTGHDAYGNPIAFYYSDRPWDSGYTFGLAVALGDPDASRLFAVE